MTLYEKIIAIYPQLNKEDFSPKGNIDLRNDGEGDYIVSWNHPTLAKPTNEELA